MAIKMLINIDIRCDSCNLLICKTGASEDNIVKLENTLIVCNKCVKTRFIVSQKKKGKVVK